MSNSFHLAIPAGDLKKAEAFYTDILGCKTGNREDGKWVDIDFWGNELTLHQTSMKLPRERHDVDMGQVPVPHFGVHLKKEVFNKIKSNIKLSSLAGLFGFSATISWFYSFSLVQAALVRAVGQIELLFSYISSRFMFKEKIRYIEIFGIIIFIFGLVLVIFNK